jgi:hypothetical protein
MGKQRILVASMALSCLSLVTSDGLARLTESWPYEKLFKNAELVVLATAVSSEKCSDEFTDHPWPLEFVGVNTTMEIKHVLKGKTDGKKITVLHFRFGDAKKGIKAEDARIIFNGPHFVDFRTKPVTIKIEGENVRVPKPEYMLFLKKLKDGRYEAVSGKIDPQESVRELFEPLPKELGGSKSE